jgi:glutathione S-transferase
MTNTEPRTRPVSANPEPPQLVLCEVGDPSIDGLDSYSPFCAKIHRALRIAGFAYRRRHGDGPWAFADLNPARQVPVLLVDGRPVADSTEICLALDELSGGRLLPRDPILRARAQLAEELADTAINGFLVAARWADDDNWPAVRDLFFAGVPAPARGDVADPIRTSVIDALVARDVWRAGADRCWKRLRDLLDQLDAVAPARGFWVGDAPSVADAALFGQLANLRQPLTPRQAGEVARRSRLSSYLDRVDAATR